jgi:hypothetical protein
MDCCQIYTDGRELFNSIIPCDGIQRQYYMRRIFYTNIPDSIQNKIDAITAKIIHHGFTSSFPSGYLAKRLLSRE